MKIILFTVYKSCVLHLGIAVFFETESRINPRTAFLKILGSGIEAKIKRYPGIAITNNTSFPKILVEQIHVKICKNNLLNYSQFNSVFWAE